MIEITFGKMTIPENERFIGFAGDNLHSTKTFILKNVKDENCIYRLYLTFDDGTINYFVLDSKIENGSTYLTWNISVDHILKSGLVKAQIKAFCENGRIFHSSYDYFVVAPTADFDAEISEKENSEFLDYEKRLNEILSYLSDYESDFVPVSRTVAGLNLSSDITTDLLCESMKIYPILRLSSAPTKTTAGKIGQLAFERSTTNGIDFVNRLYICISVNQNGEYIWMNVSSDNTGHENLISDIFVNSNGELEITFSDGENKNLGKVTGDNGKDGKNGEDGEDGYTPIKGVDYFDGKDGKNGEDGQDGQDGKTPVLGVDYFTDSDKEYIISSVIDYFGGKPLYGFVDENNNIVVSGALSDGEYTVKYELEDGTTVDIGELTLGGTSEPEIPQETNYFNENTAQLNFRLGSSGSPSAFDGMVTTDFIEYTEDMAGKRFYASGIEQVMSSTYSYNARVVYYDSNKTKVAEFNDSYFNIFDEDVGVLTTYGAFTGNGYIRISLVVKDNASVTIDDVADLTITLK